MKIAYIACVFVAAIASVHAVANGGMFFLTPPRDMTVREGQSLTLYCTINIPGTRHMWIKDDVIISQDFSFINLEDISRFSITGEANSYNLRISQAKQEDAGIYKCVVATGSSGIISDPAHLEIQCPPTHDIPRCSSDTHLAVALGETVHVSCAVSGGVPPPVVRLYSQQRLLAENNQDGQIIHSWIVDEADEGAVFNCESDHILWPDTRYCRIGPFSIIKEPIGIVLVPLSTEVIVGKPTAFVCRQSAPVKSAFHWTIGGIDVDLHDSRFSLDIGEDSSILHIHEISDEHSGTVVSCVVESSAGTATREVTIQLKSEYLPFTPVVPVTRNNAQIPKLDEEYPMEGPIAADSIIKSAGFIVTVTGIGAAVIIIALLTVLGCIVVSRRESAVAKVTDPIIYANEDDYYFRSRNVAVRKTWFAPVHESTKMGISNSFAMEGHVPGRLQIIQDDDILTGSTDA